MLDFERKLARKIMKKKREETDKYVKKIIVRNRKLFRGEWFSGKYCVKMLTDREFENILGFMQFLREGE